MKITLAIAAAVLLSACASGGDYKAYLAAHSEAQRLTAETQKPLVELTAHTGQPITGLAGLRVYMPTQAPVVQQARPNEWAAVVGQGLSIVGTVGGIVAAGRAASSLADSVGNAATAGYGYIQAPAANVTTTTTSTHSVGAYSGENSGNSGRIAGSSMSDSTSSPTVVTQPPPVVVTQPAPVIVQP